jgi:hypothetical protein
MYCCNTCKAEFETPRVNHCGGGDSGEPWAVCPSCESDNIAECDPCMLCGNAVSEDDKAPYIDAHMSCVSLVTDKAKTILKRHFSDAEYRLFCEYYEIS